jgi:hypothetical protein
MSLKSKYKYLKCEVTHFLLSDQDRLKMLLAFSLLFLEPIQCKNDQPPQAAIIIKPNSFRGVILERKNISGALRN